MPHVWLRCGNVDEIIDKLVVSSDYKRRVASVKDFNTKNRWKKRGIYLTPLRYSCLGYYNALLSIYNVDGSVAVSHGGIEMGKGIHTKVAQLVAHELSIDMDLISMKATNNLVNPNGQFTAASVTTELICEAMLECCKKKVKKASLFLFFKFILCFNLSFIVLEIEQFFAPFGVK